LAGGQNRYGYAAANPLTNADPTGLFPNPAEGACVLGPNPVCVGGVTADVLTSVLAGALGAAVLTSPGDTATSSDQSAAQSGARATTDGCKNKDDDKCEKATQKARSAFADLTSKRIPQYLSGGTGGSDANHYKSILEKQLALRDAIRRVRLYCNPLPGELPEWERVANLAITPQH
jgi:hypothetical protein